MLAALTQFYKSSNNFNRYNNIKNKNYDNRRIKWSEFEITQVGGPCLNGGHVIPFNCRREASRL